MYRAKHTALLTSPLRSPAKEDGKRLSAALIRAVEACECDHCLELIGKAFELHKDTKILFESND